MTTPTGAAPLRIFSRSGDYVCSQQDEDRQFPGLEGSGREPSIDLLFGTSEVITAKNMVLAADQLSSVEI